MAEAPENQSPPIADDPLAADASATDSTLTSPPAVPPTKKPRQEKLTFKKRFQAGAALVLGKVLIGGVGMTWRYRLFYKGDVYRRGDEKPYFDKFRGDGGPMLFALWHGSCLPLLYYWKKKGVCVVTSRSNDGQILARLLRSFGYQTVTGSSTRGGTQALINMARIVKAGADSAIAVDGPRGPALVVKPGIVLLAKLTGRPIMPIASCGRRFWRFQSWDRIRLPLPFTRVTLSGADPIRVPPDASHEVIEEKRQELERVLRELQQATDDFVQPRIWKLPDRKKRPKKPE